MNTNKPKSQWTKEECFEFVKEQGYTSRSELERKCQSVCVRMRKNKWLDEYFGSKPKPVSQWTKEECFEFVKEQGYTSRSELERKCQAVCDRMRKNKWMDECFGINTKLSDPISHWDKKRCIDEVNKSGYQNRTELQHCNYALWSRMNDNGWLKECFGSKGSADNPITKWTKEECFEAISKRGYKTKSELDNWSQMAFKMRKEGWIDEYFGTTPRKKPHDFRRWTKKQCFDFIRDGGYKNPTELDKDYQVLTKYMREQNWIIDYPWESYRQLISTNTTNITKAAIDFLKDPGAIHLDSRFFAIIWQATGCCPKLKKDFMGLTKTDADSVKRQKAINDSITDLENTPDEELYDVSDMFDELTDEEVEDKMMEEAMWEQPEKVDPEKVVTEKLAQLETIDRFMSNIPECENYGEIVESIVNIITNDMICLWFDGNDDAVNRFLNS